MASAIPRIERVSPAVHTIHYDVKGSGWEAWVLLASDRHHDNAHADHALEKKHLDQAKERNAAILDGGDLFCAMQGKWDKRADKRQLRPELQEGSYLDTLVNYNADFFKPYAKNFLLAAPGNHETSIARHHETHLTERFVQRLRDAGSPVEMGSYAGYVGFRFTIDTTKKHTLWLARHHGYGGGGPVTRGVIQTNRMAVYLPDATFVWSGHTHDEWVVPIARSRISKAGVPYLDEQCHIKTAGYKDEYTPHDGYHIEGGRPPKGLGAAWIRFYVEPGDTTTGRVRYEVTRAK